MEPMDLGGAEPTLDFNEMTAVLPDGMTGDITIMVDELGFPTHNKHEAVLIIISLDDGAGFIAFDLD